MDLLDRMLGHDHWATTRLIELSRDLTDAQLDRSFDIGRGTLRETLDHLVHVIDFWIRLMNGQPAPERAGQGSIAELRERHERYYDAFAALARRARDEGRLEDTFIDHYAYRQTVGATILQVSLHNALHRSEARHMLERLGVPDLRGDFDPQEWEHATHYI